VGRWWGIAGFWEANGKKGQDRLRARVFLLVRSKKFTDYKLQDYGEVEVVAGGAVGEWRGGKSGRRSDVAYFLPALFCLVRGGVMGRPESIPP